MVIVDEAHHARVRRSGKRREETRLYRVVRDLASPDAFSKRAALFLTATPMQLDSGELYSLIELLDPALFPTEEHFDHHRAELPGLSRLVHELPSTASRRRTTSRTRSSPVSRRGSTSTTSEAAERCRAATTPSRSATTFRPHLLSEILIRNRKKIVGGFMPRHAHRWEVESDAARADGA